MKDIICANYNININNIYLKNDNYFFFVNNYKIDINICSKEKIIEYRKLIDLSNNMYSKIRVNTFIKNNSNDYFTKYENDYIFLIRINNFENIFDKSDIFKFWNYNSNLDNYNILEEWKKEIDNLENNIIELNKEYKQIQNSINYFIGMGENAIELLTNYKSEIINNNDSIGHKVNNCFIEKYNLFNPLTFIKTNKMYDVSNYIKYSFFKNELDYNEVEDFFLKGNEYENIFLFCNLLYPNMYFDVVKNILNNRLKESVIKKIEKKIKKYNKLLCFCKKLVKNDQNIQLINWFD